MKVSMVFQEVSKKFQESLKKFRGYIKIVSMGIQGRIKSILREISVVFKGI